MNRNTRSSVVALLVGIGVYASGAFLAVDAIRAESISGLISRAGQSADEKERYQILNELREEAGLGEGLRADLERLLPVIDDWANGPDHWEAGDKNRGYLNDFFSGKAKPGSDYPPAIDPASPLYPIWCMYRARMLISMPIQSGNLIRDPDLRSQYYDEGRRLLRIAYEAFPANRVLGMYLDQPIPWPARHAPDPNAPEWANLQREGLEKLTEVIHWWIDERQMPDGQFGGGWGDDVEMWRWWTPVLIGFEDPKVRAAQARISRGMYALPRMAGGYTSNLTDVQHTGEDTGDTCTPMMHIDPEDPVWKQRAQRLAQLMETLWTGRNERGLLQFKSTYFTSGRVDASTERACDTVYHPRAVQPALLLWQRTGDEALGRLFSAWMDTWVDAAGRAERGKPAGIVPSAIHWPDGRVGGVGEQWWFPENHSEPYLYAWPSAMSMMTSTLLLTYWMTGNDVYMAPVESMAEIRWQYLRGHLAGGDEPGSATWCARRLRGPISEALGKYRLLSGDTGYDVLLRADASGYVKFRLTGNKEAFSADLLKTVEAFRVNRPGYTEEVRWTDRVLNFHTKYVNYYASTPLKSPSTKVLYSSVTGDFGDPQYFPMNAVRWNTGAKDIAALVVDSGSQHFDADLYHFGEGPRTMGATFYLLAEGEYSLVVKDEGEDTAILVRRFEVKGPGARVEFHLPSRRLVRLEVRRLESHQMPDFDESGSVDFEDFLIFAGGYGLRTEDPDFDAHLDLDGNGTVAFPDFLAFALSFGK